MIPAIFNLTLCVCIDNLCVGIDKMVVGDRWNDPVGISMLPHWLVLPPFCICKRRATFRRSWTFIFIGLLKYIIFNDLFLLSDCPGTSTVTCAAACGGHPFRELVAREFAYVYARIALTARNRRRAVPTDLESRTNFQPFDWGHGMIGEIEMMAGGISLHRERGAAPCRW
jgi:hypothetical protein